MSKEEIKNRFKQTKLGEKVFKKYRLSLIIFIVTHIIMLISFILFATKISSILSGSLNIIIILIGCSLVISAILTFIAGFLTIYYDGKIVGCIELFELMLKAKVKTNNNDD